MKLLVKNYVVCKYWTEEKPVEVVYDDVASLDVKHISDEEIYAEGFDDTDEFEEYAILTFADGSKSTFCNSHVDVFKI